MLVKQFTMRAFEINVENEESFLDFFTKNRELLQKYFVVLSGNVTQNIQKILEEEDILFTIGSLKNNSCIKNSYIKKMNSEKQKDSKVFNFPIRSGMEIESEGDIILLKRVNSASTIVTNGNFISLDIVEGKVECNGEFMFLKASSKALVLFHNKDISSYLRKDSFFSVYLNEKEEIEIKEFMKGKQ